MILIPLGVVWAGYLLVWYGAVNLKGPGTGLLDLADPTRIGKVASSLGAAGTASAQGPAAPGARKEVGGFIASPEARQQEGL